VGALALVSWKIRQIPENAGKGVREIPKGGTSHSNFFEEKKGGNHPGTEVQRRNGQKKKIVQNVGSAVDSRPASKGSSRRNPRMVGEQVEGGGKLQEG